MARVTRPCYCTREEVMRALDVQQAAYRTDQVDRAILAATDAVEGLTQRKFYPVTGTRSFDWPNFQYAYPWRLWLEGNELASQPSLVVTGSKLAVPVTIPSTDYNVRPSAESPPEAGPPYRVLELRRDRNSSFGSNPTPQLDIAITGDWGWNTNTVPAGTLAGAINASATTITVSDGVLLGVGNWLLAGTERMVVTDSDYIDTGITFSSGITASQASDRVGVVADGTQFSVGEVIMVGFEWMVINQIVGNNIVVKRAWDGSLLTTHTGTDHIWARRKFTVLRGQLGTIAASHSQGDALAVGETPGLVNELAVAEALVWLSQEPAAYAGSPSATAAQGSHREPKPGLGLPDLRQRVLDSRFAQKARSRAV